MLDAQQRLDRIERILAISHELVSTSPLQAILRNIVDAAAELTDSEYAGILLSDESASALRFVAATQYPDRLFNIPVPLDASIAGAAFSSGQPVVVPDASVDPHYYPKVGELIGVPARSLLAVPLQLRERKIGVLEAENKKGARPYDATDVEILTALAVQSTLAIENARLIGQYQDLLHAEQTQRELSEALRLASIALGSTLDYSQVIDRILEQITHVVVNDASNVMIIEEGDIGRVFRGRGYARFGTAETLTETTLKVEEVAGFREMRATGQPLVVVDVTLDKDWVYSRPEHTWIKSYVGAPILLRGEVIGFLNAMSAVPGFYTASDAERLQAFAYHAASALDNARLYQQAQREIAQRIQLAEELRQHRDLLETRVAERTADLALTNERLRQEMREREEAQAQVTQQQRGLAALEERERLGRELHDGLAQVMGYLNVQAQTVQTHLSYGEIAAAQTELEHMMQAAQAAQEDIRGYILSLRIPAVAPGALRQTLEAYLRQFGETCHLEAGLRCPVEVPAFSPPVEEQIFRIVMEALTNIRKHAAAHQVEVQFSFEGEQAQVTVADDGRGFDPSLRVSEGHWGLSIMRERASQVRGQLELHSAVGQGTQVVLRVPRLLPSAAPDWAPIQGLRVMIVDDHSLFADGLRNLLTGRGLDVVGVAPDGLQAQEMARTLHPAVILMDIEMPRCNGLEATRAIQAELPEVKIVMLTVSAEEGHLFEALKSGAAGYLLKSLKADDLLNYLAELTQGRVVLSPVMAAKMLGEFTPASAAPSPVITDSTRTPEQSVLELTPRQTEILRLVAEGLSYKEVGAVLFVAEATVKYHIGEILSRLHLKHRREAIAAARRARLIPDTSSE